MHYINIIFIHFACCVQIGLQIINNHTLFRAIDAERCVKFIASIVLCALSWHSAQQDGTAGRVGVWLVCSEQCMRVRFFVLVDGVWTKNNTRHTTDWPPCRMGTDRVSSINPQATPKQ